jgi:hypothetical protein
MIYIHLLDGQEKQHSKPPANTAIAQKTMTHGLGKMSHWTSSTCFTSSTLRPEAFSFILLFSGSFILETSFFAS